MKPQTKKHILRAALIAPIAIVAFALVACGSGGKKGYATGGFVPGCNNCPAGSGTVLAASLSAWQGAGVVVQLGLRVHQPGAAYPPNMYYGPVQTSGFMTVQGPTGVCTVLPVGNYQIATLPPNGNYAPDMSYYPWNLTAVDFEVVHTSGFRAQVRVDYAEIYAQPLMTGVDGGQYSSAIYGQVNVMPMTAPPGGCYIGPVSLFFPKY